MLVDSEPLYARIFSRAPIYDLVLSCLSPRSLVWLARTCRVVYFAVAEFKGRAFNVNTHFSRYFSNPIAFRSLQARTNTLVSGSNALQFLDRTFYPEADLDLYTHPGHSFEVAQFLVEAEGYQYAPRDEDENDTPDWKDVIRDDWDGTQPRVFRGVSTTYPLEGITSVWTFKKGALKVQIIEASSSPVEAILAFHSSTYAVLSVRDRVLTDPTACVMNLITSEAAYALYPLATFVERKSLCMPPGRHSAGAIQKYVHRGWRVYFIPTPGDISGRAPFMLNVARWVGDADTWVLPLDQTGIPARPPLSKTSAPLTFDHVRCNGWRLKQVYEGLDNAGYYYKAHKHRLQTTVFRYNYGIPDEDLWIAIRGWANVQGRLCHGHLSKGDWVWYVCLTIV